MSNERSEIFTITDEECPLCGEYLIIVKYDNKENLSSQITYTSEALMTETLAKVYLQQNNYQKALQAYKILSLKYPEKSGFFADQIRAINKQINIKDS